MNAEDVVAQLFAVRMGLQAPTDVPNGPVLRGYRDLFQVPRLMAYPQKTRLLAAAEGTRCAGVVMDVLLFLSQTMTRDAFQRELAKHPIARQHWVQYETKTTRTSSTMGGDSEQSMIAMEADVSRILSIMLSTKVKHQDMAMTLLDLVFGDRQMPLHANVIVAKEVLRVAKRTRPYKIPQWGLELLEEFITLSEIQLETEKMDSFNAPSVQTMAAYLDKRARGANKLNANWRMRYFTLDATELSYCKHDAEKLSQSKNPFLDKRKKGSVMLVRGMPVTPLNYSGKVSKRPYCIQVGSEKDRNSVIIDACTPVTQAQWINALSANIRRLDLDPRWLHYPRPSVYRMSVQGLLRYGLLYHHEKDPRHVPSHPLRLQETFKLDDKRLAFASVVSCARMNEWSRLEGMLNNQTQKKGTLFQTPSEATPVIGYGPILDVLTSHRAPLGLVSKVEALYAKHEAKKPGWTCREKANDGATGLEASPPRASVA
ncbi:hypothetical protein Poli38472_001689 [Pythium oligandrum]|uniref:PH domain-containing protein n=1 Tax=Pythium oligandrum TaxID=41045 RepID=A0A8K1CWI3_PYTOL|nr:hypothetical protein Poli38472_001689 [Pythium oligandrum]|eukprot:TMW69533.1 hypothetical protein Poli38472_001689 [Pythium oligandrum]